MNNRELYKVFGKIYGVKTKKEGIDFIRSMIKTSDLWVVRGIAAIYSRQTSIEQRNRETSERNGVGFSKYHANQMSGYAQTLLSGGKLTPTQMYMARQIVMKYSEQLYDISIEKISYRMGGY